MVVAETIVGLGALKSALDIAKGIKDLTDVAGRNAAVIALQKEIVAAQQAQSTLIKQINELESKVAGFEAWNAQKQRYQLKDFGGGTLAYELKPEEARGEPAHRICPSCYENRKRSVLQFKGRNAFSQDMYSCPECKTQFNFGVKQQPQQGGPLRRPGGRRV